MQVTVLTAVYNAGAFLRSAVESVLQQDFASFEMLLCDDGSTDESWSILQEFRTDSRVRLFRNETNRGMCVTRNRLLQEVRTPFMQVFDADDLLLPGAMSFLHGLLNSQPDVGVAHGCILSQEFDEMGNPLGEPEPVEPPTWELLGCTIGDGGTMARTELVRDVAGWDEQLRIGVDWDLWMRVSERTRVHHAKDREVYLWRRHPSSTTRSLSPEERLRDSRRVVEKAIERRYGTRLPASVWNDA